MKTNKNDAPVYTARFLIDGRVYAAQATTCAALHDLYIAIMNQYPARLLSVTRDDGKIIY